VSHILGPKAINAVSRKVCTKPNKRISTTKVPIKDIISLDRLGMPFLSYIETSSNFESH